uniref:Transmembrane protein n=1 Tax=Helianthus annuus TaxID=4232 RepID=A0A251UPC1_HELAN
MPRFEHRVYTLNKQTTNHSANDLILPFRSPELSTPSFDNPTPRTSTHSVRQHHVRRRRLVVTGVHRRNPRSPQSKPFRRNCYVGPPFFFVSVNLSCTFSWIILHLYSCVNTRSATQSMLMFKK